LEGTWDIENYSLIKGMSSDRPSFEADNTAMRQRFKLPKSLSIFHSSSSSGGDTPDADHVGQNAWRDRIDAEKSVERWLSEYPSTFITLTGPPGSGKQNLLSRVLKKEEK
jgi:hypothetical protein